MAKCFNCQGTGVYTGICTCVLGTVNCPACNILRSNIPVGMISCNNCSGSGHINKPSKTMQGMIVSYTQKTCFKCGGSGQLTCFKCGGSGRVQCKRCGGTGNINGQCRKCKGTGEFTPSFNKR